MIKKPYVDAATAITAGNTSIVTTTESKGIKMTISGNVKGKFKIKTHHGHIGYRFLGLVPLKGDNMGFTMCSRSYRCEICT